MTEHGHNFIREIAEAYRALEQEPALLHRIKELETAHVHDGERVARLEKRLMERAEEINELNAKLRSVEAERDDAGFRLLEAEDRVDAIRKALGVPTEVANAVAKREAEVRDELTPKPPVEVQAQPVANPTQELSISQGQATSTSALEDVPPSPTVPDGQGSEQSSASIGDAGSQGNVSTTSGPGSGASPEQAQEVPAEHSPTSSTTGQDFGTGFHAVEHEPHHGPYYGLLYEDIPQYVNFTDWLAGGGTEADYHYRRNQSQAAQ